MPFGLKTIKESDLKIGEGNMGGLVDYIYVIDREDVLDMHLPALTDENPLTITQDLTLANGKKFKQWYFTPKTGKFSQAIVGEDDGKSFEPMAEFLMPKINKVAQEQIAYAGNASLILLVKTGNDQYILIGTKDIPAKFQEGGPDGGTQFADRNHTKFSFKAGARFGAYFYEGSVDGLIEGRGLELTTFTTATATADDETVIINWLDNSAFFGAEAEATDQLQVQIKNKTRGDTFDRSNVAARSVETVSIVIFNIGTGDLLEVDVWFKNAAGKLSAKKRLTITATAT
jgi:hypothetical protein